MSEKQRLNRRLEAAVALRNEGRLDEAAHTVAEIASDPMVADLGQLTSLGLPRRLQSAMLKLAKSRGDKIGRIAYQYHLVPPPEKLVDFANFSLEERREITRLNDLPIPRVLHQIWIGDLPVPPACAAWAIHARSHGYDYRLWREADLETLDLGGNNAFANMMARGDYPGAVDIARYQILAQEGGIYLDCDWHPASTDISFHDLLPMRGLTVLAEDIPRNTGKGGLLLANSFIAATPGHLVMQRLNAVLGDVIRTLPGCPAWWTTGPLIFTLIARAGTVTLADAGFVAGSLPQVASQSDVDAFLESSNSDGLLLAWKSW